MGAGSELQDVGVSRALHASLLMPDTHGACACLLGAAAGRHGPCSQGAHSPEERQTMAEIS